MEREIIVGVEGLPEGLLFHAMGKDPQDILTKIYGGGSGIKIKKVPTPEELKEIAESFGYWIGNNGTRQLCIPSVNMQACLKEASGVYKVGKISARQLVCGTVSIQPVRIPLGTDKYEIDIRTVPNKNKGGSVAVTIRPKLYPWSAEFKILFDDLYLNEPLIKKIVEDAGKRIGILSFRPAKGGPFGRFKVVKWEHS